MANLVYRGSMEKYKLEVTKWFVNNYVDKDSRVLECFAGLGRTTDLYAEKAGYVFSIEKDSETFSGLEEKFRKYSNVHVLNQDNLKYLNDKQDFDYSVVDLDPWGNANKQIIRVLERMKSEYLLVTSGEPYAIHRFKTIIKKYGTPWIDKWECFSIQLFNRFIVPEAEKNNKKAELLKYFDSHKICRLVVRIN